MEKDISASFSSLKQRLLEVFPQLQQKIFSMFWSDKDADMVTIDSDEELAIALAEMPPPVFKIVIKVKAQENGRNGLGVTFVESANTPGVISERPGIRSSVECNLCNEFGHEVPPNMLNFGQPGNVIPKKLLKRIQKIQGKAAKQKFGPTNGFQDGNLVQPGLAPPPYFGFTGYGRGLFHGSVRGGFRGRQGLEGIHGGFNSTGT